MKTRIEKVMMILQICLDGYGGCYDGNNDDIDHSSIKLGKILKIRNGANNTSRCVELGPKSCDDCYDDGADDDNEDVYFERVKRICGSSDNHLLSSHTLRVGVTVFFK